MFVTVDCNCNYNLHTKLPWPRDSERTFWSSSQAATCSPLTCLPHTAKTSQFTLWSTTFMWRTLRHWRLGTTFMHQDFYASEVRKKNFLSKNFFLFQVTVFSKATGVLNCFQNHVVFSNKNSPPPKKNDSKR